MSTILEICCDSISSAIKAQEGGADRIELCENLAQGGVTPSAGKIKLAKKLLDIPIFILIRPRKADFLYNEHEFSIMLEDIDIAKSLGADGIVSGILLPNGSFDYERMQKMVEAAAPLPFTCHRAFDMCSKPEEAIEEFAKIGIKRILTSGQQPTALMGKLNLAKFSEMASGRLSIMACGNLLPVNIGEIAQIDNITEFHSAPNRLIASRMIYRGITPMGDEDANQEFRWQEVDSALVKGMRRVLDSEGKSMIV